MAWIVGSVESFENVKVIQGSGFRKKKKKEKSGPIIPDGKVKVEEPLLLPSANDANKGQKLISNTKLKPKEVAEAYLARFPALRAAAERFLGGERNAVKVLDQAMKGNRRTRQQVEGFLNLFLAVPTSSAAPKASSGTGKSKPRPAKPKGKRTK